MKKLLTIGSLLAVLFSGVALADEDWDAGVAAYKAKKLADAAAAFQRYVEKVPDAYQGHMMLGQVLLANGQAAKAVPHLSKADELKGGDAGLQLALGRALLASGKDRDACGVLGKVNAASLPKANQTVLYQMRAKAGCTGGGLADMKKVAQAKNDGENWAAYGVAALNAGDVPEAVAALDKAASLSPNDAKIQKSLVNTLVRQARTTRGAAKDGVYKKAVGSAQKLVQLDPSFSNQLLLGETQLGAKDYNSAVKSFQGAAAKNPSDWLPHYYIGQAYTASSQNAQAVEPLNKALAAAKTPDDRKKVNFQLGFVYEKLKRYDEAVKFYNAAGDSRAAARAQENQNIERDNAEADEHNRKIAELKAEEDRMKKEMQALPGGAPPPKP